MPQYPRDRFDDVPRDSGRVGAHRAVPRAGGGWRAFAWAALATGVLVAAGVAWLAVANQSFQFTNPLSSASSAPAEDPAASEDDTQEPEATAETVAPVTDPSQVDPDVTTITVLNGTDTAGLAARAADALADAGWTVGSQGNASDGAPTSIVYWSAAEDEGVALGLAQELGIGTVQQSSAFPGAAVTVVLGDDYAG